MSAYIFLTNNSSNPTTSRIISINENSYYYNNSFPNESLNDTNNNSRHVLLEHAPELSRSAIVRAIVLTLMATISLIGNIATMWNIHRTRVTRRTSRHSWSAIYSLIFHLSIADVLVTGFCIIGEAAWSYTVEWLADDITCKAVKLFQMFSLYLSTYILVLIGVDRWIAVKYPMKSLNMSKRCYRFLGGAYILSLILSLPQFFIFRVAKGPFIEDFYQCVTHGFYTAEWQEQLYATLTLFFTFIIPLCILIVSYLSTFKAISESEKMFQSFKLVVYAQKPLQTNRQRIIHKAKMKSLRISVVIIIAFLICWTPYNVMMIIFIFLNPDKRLEEDLQSGIFFFGMSNSLVNPLIYGAFHLSSPIKSNNIKNKYCFTRENSVQRSTSLMTSTTQVEINCRHPRYTSYINRMDSVQKDRCELNGLPKYKVNIKSYSPSKPVTILTKTLNSRKNLNQQQIESRIFSCKHSGSRLILYSEQNIF